MSIAFDHRDPGTAESVWLAEWDWSALPTLDLDVDRLMVLAAHPDDETLGAGGLLATAAARGIPTAVVIVTDGAASHPGSLSGRDLALERRVEVIHALHDLAPGASVSFLGFDDGGIREAVAAVRTSVSAALAAHPADRVLLVSPWSGDAHRDHRVLGEVAASLHTDLVQVAAYPIWFWHWGEPGMLEPHGWRLLPLSPETTAAKMLAIRRHRSQLEPLSAAPEDEPVVHAGMREHFERSFETFIEVPRPVRRPTPTLPRTVDGRYFDGFYERHTNPWQLETSSYEIRKRGLLLASLTEPRFDRVLEIGCSTGITTAELARRANAVVATDVAAEAIRRARDRVHDFAQVDFRIGDATRGIPGGPFDLVVLSEVGYYWSTSDLGRVLDGIAAELEPGGTLVACHWRHPFEQAPNTGDGVHAAIAQHPAFERILMHIEEAFSLESFRRRPAAQQAETRS
ncbi:PIG-L family deacetylase [Agromyces aureus]|uniref:Methyltransferase domain-containing protein n=1 Tax=Agromyces aureus TaxID=453304 RepID=A0A191WGM4_9MICO|nr:PIG-L family deacetylase [Agromyces aureus]ANJ27323.1 hypothetical protein ATC03_11950 [Agromyces aureus]